MSSTLACSGLAASEPLQAQQRVMSWSAHDLQVRATACATSGDQPGFVPDAYLKHLDDLGLQATITADELCAVGLWERAGGGYRMLPPAAVRQREEHHPRAPGGEREQQATAWAQLARPIVVTPPCAACGTPAARIELVAPGQLPAQWDQWPGTVQAALVRERQPGQWHLLVAGPATGNGYGEVIDTARAGQVAQAFQPPLRFARVREAGVRDDAGFCADCDAPYCYQHWHVSGTGHGACPHGHPRAWTDAGRR